MDVVKFEVPQIKKYSDFTYSAERVGRSVFFKLDLSEYREWMSQISPNLYTMPVLSIDIKHHKIWRQLT